MGAPLPDMGEALGEKAAAGRALPGLVAVEGFAFLVGKAFPMGDAGGEGVGEIHKAFGGNDPAGVIQAHGVAGQGVVNEAEDKHP